MHGTARGNTVSAWEAGDRHGSAAQCGSVARTALTGTRQGGRKRAEGRQTRAVASGGAIARGEDGRHGGGAAAELSGGPRASREGLQGVPVASQVAHSSVDKRPTRRSAGWWQWGQPMDGGVLGEAEVGAGRDEGLLQRGLVQGRLPARRDKEEASRRRRALLLPVAPKAREQWPGHR